MARRLQLIPLLSMLALAACSCSHPTQPQATDAVTISGPKSGYLHALYGFKASINFTTSAQLIYKWVFPDTTISGNGLDSIARSFADTGNHIFSLHVIRTGDNTELCSASDTIRITDTTTPPPDPNDSSSHNFTWAVYTNVMGQNNMTGCWVFGPNDIYALNQDLYHFDGSNWSQATLNGHAPGALSGSSLFGLNPTDFWIISYSWLYHWNGSTVATYKTEQLISARPQILHGAWGTSSNDMYFVGDSGTILHFDGTNWTKMSSGTTKELNSISGTSDNNIWAAGYNISTGESELLHYDGSSWLKDTLSLAGLTENWGINGVFACDSGVHHTIATSGWTIFRRTDQNPWRSDSGVVPNNIGGRLWMGKLCGNNPNDLFALGDFGLLLHWSGHTWKRYDQFLAESDPNFIPQAISMKNDAVCVVGYKDGSSWVLVGQR